MLAVIKHLEQLGKGATVPKDITEGICMEIKQAFGSSAMMEVMSLIPDWPKYSGNKLFPIPCPYDGDAKLRYLRTKNLWYNRYGNLRKNLCMFLAEQLREKYGL